MKYAKKLTVLMLLLAMVLCFSGCGAFQAQMAKTTTRMAKLENFHTDVEAYLGALMTVGGQVIRMEATITGGFDTETDPLLIQTDLRLETLGVERNLRYYIQKDYDTWSFYPWDEERTMDQMSVQQKSAKRTRTTQALKLLIKCGDYFADPVDDVVNGAHARRYDGFFPDEYVDEALVLLDLKEQEATETAAESAEIVIDGAESPAPEVEAAAAEGADAENAEDGETEEEPKGLPGSIWINDEDMIVQVDVDLAVFLQKLLDQGLESLLTEYDLDGLALEGELQYVDARLTFSQFDEVAALRLPDT